jgi:CRISPR-associated exonuclease Cas4
LLLGAGVTIADEAERRRALTELKSTLLVEAAAGTGKTSLLTGRATLLLASGVQPQHIAAITFTDPAASELAARIRGFIHELLRSRIPDELAPALRDGLTDRQRTNLLSAQQRLDELTATTIHGFCRSLIQGYAVEADIDPGAQIMDEAETELAFERCFDQWLTRRLGGPAQSGDPIVALSTESPRQIVKTLRELAQFRRRHRTAQTLIGDLDARAEQEFVASVDEFRRWLSLVRSEPKTQKYVEQLVGLAAFYAGAFAPMPDFSRLWQLAHPPWMEGLMLKDSFVFAQYRRLSAWRRAAANDAGERLNGIATDLFESARDSFGTLLGRIEATLVAALSTELDELLDSFAQFKRAAAVLDFDDLLHEARSMLRRHDVVRRKLGERYPHILVDEAQDTDPIQAEILFLLAAEGEAGGRWQDRRLRPGALFMVGDPKQAIYQFRGADIACYMQARSAVERCFPGHVVEVRANFRSRPDNLSHVNKCFEAPLKAPGQPGYVALAPTIGGAEHGLPCVAKMTIPLPRDAKAEEIRDAGGRGGSKSLRPSDRQYACAYPRRRDAAAPRPHRAARSDWRRALAI